MDIIIQKTQQHIPQIIRDILGAIAFMVMIWGCSYLFLLLE